MARFVGWHSVRPVTSITFDAAGAGAASGFAPDGEVIPQMLEISATTTRAKNRGRFQAGMGVGFMVFLQIARCLG
jgi:hypothetical protein